MNNELMKFDELNMSEEELFSRVNHSDLESEKITAPRYSYWRSVFRVFFRKKTNVVILSLFALLLLFTFLYPAIVPYDQFENLMDPTGKHLTPSMAIDKYGFQLKWIFGAGKSGEATFDAVWNGAKISISMAFICAAINMTIGIVLGAVWGFSKKVDMVMTQVNNIIGNVPYILLISVLVLIFSAGFWTMVFALTVTGWLGLAYFIRTQVIIIRDREYNLASRCLGTPILRIALKNILPFMISVIVTLAASEIPSYIGYEVFLSYIGMGMSEMSLGKLIYEAENAMLTPGWQIEFWAPVAVASIITIVLYVVGQNLGDASDPRTHM